MLADEANKAVSNGADGQISLVVEAVMDRLSDEEKEKLLFIHLCERTIKMTHCDCPSCQARRAEFRETGEFKQPDLNENGKSKYDC